MKFKAYFLLGFFVSGVTSCFLSWRCSVYQKDVSGNQRIELKKDWKFRQKGKEPWYEARIPGSIHTDLLSNNLIEEPFFRNNEKNLQWIEDEGWEYQTVLRIEVPILENNNIELELTGLDTYAKIYLNNSLLFFANNMFREWKINCKKFLKAGDNTLRIHFLPPVKNALPEYESLNYKLPGGVKVVTRKAGYHYGWDWGPRFVTSGIWRPVYLRIWNEATIENLQIIQKNISSDKAELAAFLDIKSSYKGKANVSIFQDGMKTELTNSEIHLIPGENTYNLDFEIRDPKLWWTNGLGNAHLYNLIAELNIGGKTVDRTSQRIGLRTLKVVREKDEKGRSFYFELNGVPVFMKGANYIPQDSFPGQVSSGRYRIVMKNVVDANMNMLRVWGGGIYEDDILYDLCDENGVLVWQDFMFACAMYPGDIDFLKNVEEEAIQNVKRLRNHPCLALWCGNNEVEEAWHNWGWQSQYGYSTEEAVEIWSNYEKLFHDLLPGVIEKYDRGRFYWPSSPQFGRGDPRSLTEGDSHYWGVWHDKEPFEIFEEKTGRFVSEFGFQSFPEFITIKSFTVPEDWNIESEVMLSHQKHLKGNQLIKTYMERYYRTPKDFKSFLFVSQLLQAEGMRIAIEAHRRAMPYCMGTLYWQLNDCWPVVSWSSFDYFGRWKAVHYCVKKAFAPLLVSPVVTNDVLRVFVVSDKLIPFPGKLKLNILNFSGDIVWQKEIDTTVQKNSSKSFFELKLSEILKGRDRKNLVLEALLFEGGTLLSENLFYFLPPKELDLPSPSITRKVVSNNDGYFIELRSEELAKNIYLLMDECEGFFSDNYFDLLPGKTKIVRFITEDEVVNFLDKLKIMTLTDTYN